MTAVYKAEQIAKIKSRVTYIGALVNFFLSFLKIGFGVLGQSAALIADGIHSFSDLASDFLVIAAIKLGSREADNDHPYGHRRFETMATVLLGGGLVVISAGIAWNVIERILHPESLLIPTENALGVALVSILANEGLYQYTKRIAKQTRSKLLMANAWHHRSDAISSIVVLFGIMAVFLGYPFADAAAAIIVALMVAKIGLTLVFESIKELVDTSLPEKFVDEIKLEIHNTEGVVGIHMLRTRQMGEDAYVDAHIVVDPRITVSEGHMIGDAVRDKLKTKYDDIIDVLVHIDPEDDEYREVNAKPVSRQEIHNLLKRFLAEMNANLEDFKIHYLNGCLELELVFTHSKFSQQHQIEIVKRRCAALEQEIENINKVIVFFKV